MASRPEDHAQVYPIPEMLQVHRPDLDAGLRLIEDRQRRTEIYALLDQVPKERWRKTKVRLSPAADQRIRRTHEIDRAQGRHTYHVIAAALFAVTQDPLSPTYALRANLLAPIADAGPPEDPAPIFDTSTPLRLASPDDGLARRLAATLSRGVLEDWLLVTERAWAAVGDDAADDLMTRAGLGRGARALAQALELAPRVTRGTVVQSTQDRPSSAPPLVHPAPPPQDSSDDPGPDEAAIFPSTVRLTSGDEKRRGAIDNTPSLAAIGFNIDIFEDAALSSLSPQTAEDGLADAGQSALSLADIAVDFDFQ